MNIQIALKLAYLIFLPVYPSQFVSRTLEPAVFAPHPERLVLLPDLAEEMFEWASAAQSCIFDGINIRRGRIAELKLVKMSQRMLEGLELPNKLLVLGF
jgi:hypothetical protein